MDHGSVQRFGREAGNINGGRLGDGESGFQESYEIKYDSGSTMCHLRLD